jgi:hypothetical protein
VDRTFAVVLAVAAGLVAGAAPARAAAPYESIPGQQDPAPVFSVKYTGTSHTTTTYASQPPNEGGKADDNHVRDRSRQRWALTFPAGVAIPTCEVAGADDPCAAVTGPTVADGKTSASGRIDHTHVDGLFRDLDSAAHCSVKARRVSRRNVSARIGVVFDPAQAAFVVTAYNPLIDALALLPPTCPGMGDSLDLILDNYFTPGFSFADGYGSDVWFTSASIAVPASVWHGSSRIRLRLGRTATGTPPRTCAVVNPSFEQCRTTGDWSGVLTFTARR